jgi:hypothetical protein
MVVTDERSHGHFGPCGSGHLMNVAALATASATARGDIDGWSEAVLEYIREAERSAS